MILFDKICNRVINAIAKKHYTDKIITKKDIRFKYIKKHNFVHANYTFASNIVQLITCFVDAGEFPLIIFDPMTSSS